jgi:hypothetical protein
MNLSFIPADLHLTKTQDGFYVVKLQGEEVLRSRSDKKALAKYNRLRRDLEEKFPAQEMSTERKQELLSKYIGDSLIDHNSFRPQEKKKKSGSTRTFG